MSQSKACPHCNQHARTRRKNNKGEMACPYCKKEIHIVKIRGKSVWTANGTDASRLVLRLEDYIRQRPGMKHFSFGEQDYKNRYIQIGVAKSLLQRCGYDQKLALAVIDAYCNGDRRLMPPRTMQGVIGKQFTMALAIAKWNLEQKETEKASQEHKIEIAKGALSHVEIFMPV